MKRSEGVPTKENKRKISAAAIAAAAFAIVWILLEVAFFVMAIPTADEMAGKDYAVRPTESGVYSIKAASSVRFSGEMGEIQNVFFLAQIQAEEEEPHSKPLTLKVRAYDPSAPGSLLTYKIHKFCVGEEESAGTVVRVDIPAEAGEVVLEFSHEGSDYLVGDITFNYSKGMGFNFARCAIVLLITAICYLSSRYKLWRVYFDPKKHGSLCLAFCTVCLIISMLLAFTLSSAPLTVEYPFDSGINYRDPYEQQFDALMKGQLHLDVQPGDDMLALENPYDPSSREGLYYLWDRAFFDGKYYSYFGMAPIFTVYFPIYLITGRLPSDSTVTAIFAVMTALFFSFAAMKWASMYTKRLPLPVLLAGTLGGIFSSQIFLMMRGRAKFYYIATVAGMAFLSLFIWLILCGISGSVRLSLPEGKTPRKGIRLTLYALAGVAYGLLFMSRVNMALLCAFAVLPILWFRIFTCGTGRLPLRKIKDIVTELMALGIPVIIFVAAQLWLNYSRFGSLFEFGTTYQLTVSDISLNKLRISDLPAALFHYFLQPITFTSDPPFASLFYTRLSGYGHYVYVDTGMGLLSIPFMWILVGSGFIFADKKKKAAHKVLLGSVLFGAILVALFDFCLGGVIFRYTCDLTLLCAFAAMAVMFSLSEVREEGVPAGSSHGSGVLLTVLAVASILVSLSLAMSLNNNLTSYSPKAYIAFRDLFIFF